jgi:hypothetical protein
MGRPMNAGDNFFPTVMDTADSRLLDQFAEKFPSAGIDISPEELSELKLFYEFLTGHIQPNGECTVQCMLLWNEWVRTFRRRAHTFPKLILEKEFRAVVKDMFGIEIAEDGFRGAVYPGIRFMP